LGVLSTTWTFGTVLWSMLVFFFWVLFIWMFVVVFGEILARHDLSGWAKAGWVVLILLLPFFGILVYMIARPRTVPHYPTHHRPPGHSASEEIARAAQLRDSGDITDAEYEELKRKALA
jgi:Short C-terminal domain/Phospholipase_D-nuclease N-terminal